MHVLCKIMFCAVTIWGCIFLLWSHARTFFYCDTFSPYILSFNLFIFVLSFIDFDICCVRCTPRTPRWGLSAVPWFSSPMTLSWVSYTHYITILSSTYVLDYNTFQLWVCIRVQGFIFFVRNGVSQTKNGSKMGLLRNIYKICFSVYFFLAVSSAFGFEVRKKC